MTFAALHIMRKLKKMIIKKINKNLILNFLSNFLKEIKKNGVSTRKVSFEILNLVRIFNSS